MEFRSFVPRRSTDRRPTSPFLATELPRPPQDAPRNPFLGPVPSSDSDLGRDRPVPIQPSEYSDTTTPTSTWNAQNQPIPESFYPNPTRNEQVARNARATQPVVINTQTQNPTTPYNNSTQTHNIAPPTAPVGPSRSMPRDGIRHTAPPAPPSTTTTHSTPPADITDIGAQIHHAQTNIPHINQRVLEYYGNPQIKNILVVVGYQIHAVTPQGVLITENGPTLQRTFIPWHRVHDLKLAPGDPLLNPLTR